MSYAAEPRCTAPKYSVQARSTGRGRELDGALDAADIGLKLLTKSSNYLEPHSAVPTVREFRDRLRALPAAF
ncbi:hypothetical protein [Streptomyces sp. HC307]|uniref:hypothetical protein n=1 Tax=Streptomyces flavusporus TaxID=3385496 RepID=UPI0039173A45